MSARRTLHSTPRAAAARTQCSAQSADSACRRWSTCSARTRQPGSEAAAWSSAVESAPPLNATARGGSGSCNALSDDLSQDPSWVRPSRPRRVSSRTPGPNAGGAAVPEFAKGCQPLAALLQHLADVARLQLVQVPDERVLQGLRGGPGIAMGAAEGFGDDLVDQLVLLQALRRDAHRLGGFPGLLGAFPQDGGTALRRDHAVDGVLQHQQPVAHADGERAAG